MLEQHCVYTCDTRTATQMWKVYRFCIRFIRLHACMHIYVHTMLRSHSVSVIHGRVLFSARFPNTMALALVRTRTYPRTSTPTLTHAYVHTTKTIETQVTKVFSVYAGGLVAVCIKIQNTHRILTVVIKLCIHRQTHKIGISNAALHTYTTAECHFRKCASIALSLV